MKSHLWIVRHGHAGTLAMDERGPGLTDSGKVEIEKLKEFIKSLSPLPENMFTSPLKRAQETANILNDALGLPLDEVDWLKPGVEPSQILLALEPFAGENVAIVGHLPTLGWLYSTLLWGLPPKEIILPKASITCLSIDRWEPSSGQVRWMLSPQLLKGNL